MTDIVVTDAATIVQWSQVAGSSRQRMIDVSGQAVPFWQPDSFVPSNSLMRPNSPHQTGYVYKNLGSSGQTGELEPAWPSTGTVVDGSVTWTPQAPPASGGDTVASATWTQVNPPDSALTISGQTTTALTATAMLVGGTAGKAYSLLASITMVSGQVYDVPILLSVTAQ